MRVFLTGATGLVGRHLAARLVELGREVVCVSRDPGAARAVLPEGVEIVGADPVLPGSWQDRLAGCDAVVNLAGESVAEGRWSRAKKRRLRRSRLRTTEHVARAMAGADRPMTLINASATGYYGDAGDRALAEDAQPGQDFLARLAVEWEHTALEAEREGVRIVLLRIGVVLAREGGALPALLKPFRSGFGGSLGNGRQYFPWIHIEDLVRVILFALDRDDLAGPVNAVVPAPPTQGEFARALAAAVDKPARWPAPGFVLRLLLGEKAAMLLASQRAVPAALRALEFKFSYQELDAALADLIEP
ncbi:MAG: TIGR01777 family protein [bacterium]|nr:TIGR01777 family protein [bacterium]